MEGHFGFRSFMRATKGLMTNTLPGGRGISYTGDVYIHESNTLMIAEVVVRRGVNARNANLVIFSAPHWKVHDMAFDSMTTPQEHGMRRALMLNLIRHRIEETEVDAVDRLKDFLLQSMSPKNPERGWRDLQWTKIHLTESFLNPPLTTVKLEEESGLTS